MHLGLHVELPRPQAETHGRRFAALRLERGVDRAFSGRVVGNRHRTERHLGGLADRRQYRTQRKRLLAPAVDLRARSAAAKDHCQPIVDEHGVAGKGVIGHVFRHALPANLLRHGRTRKRSRRYVARIEELDACVGCRVRDGLRRLGLFGGRDRLGGNGG